MALNLIFKGRDLLSDLKPIYSLKTLNMKALRYLFLMLMAGVLFSGCEKDTPLFENQENIELKSANVPIPVKGKFQAEPHPDIPGRYMVSGTATHAGKINPLESFYQFTSAVIVEIDGQEFVQLEGFTKLVGANGHGFEATFLSHQTLGFPSTFKGKTFITPGTGTGQFTGATGTLDSSGGANLEGIYMTISGSLVFN
jgi:hypothetical protein